MNLNQVTVPATDMPVSVAFYEGMGLTLIVSTPDYARFECPEGDSTFSIYRTETRREPTGVVVYFECADLDARVASLQDRGYTFITPPTLERWLWREARLSDPAGNVICLFWAGEHRKNPPWRIAPTVTGIP
jgi:predicted enzyme related to lactoylglutathione lyase